MADTQVYVVDAFTAHRPLEGLNKRGRKNDKMDARGLARLSLEGRASGMAVCLISQENHNLRTLTRTYIGLQRQSTGLRVRMRALLTANGLACTATDLTGPKGQAELVVLAESASQETQDTACRSSVSVCSMLTSGCAC